MRHKTSWLVALALLGLLCSFSIAQDEEGSAEETSGEEGGEEEADAGGEEVADDGGSSSGDETEDSESEDGGDEEECEVEETDGSGSGDDDDIANILALGGENKKCKPKTKSDSDDDADGSGSGSGEDEISGADALADAIGATSCDKDGMDPKVSECLSGLEGKVNDLMTAIMGPEGGEGTLEDKITLVLVKKGVISCENETQCDDNKQCLKQTDGMSRCQNPCERPEIIHCSVPFSECVSEDHTPTCRCKENFHGNGTEVCIPMGFDTEENKRGYRMFDEEYLEWENATQKCQELGARLPVLSDTECLMKSILSGKMQLKSVRSWEQDCQFCQMQKQLKLSRNTWKLLTLMYLSNGIDQVEECGLDFSTAQVMVSPGLMVRELLPIQPPVGFLSGRVGDFYHRRQAMQSMLDTMVTTLMVILPSYQEEEEEEQLFSVS